MLRDKIIRAWKDPEYRVSLNEEELNALPESPAGAIELTDEELDTAVGGSWRQSFSASRSQQQFEQQFALNVRSPESIVAAPEPILLLLAFLLTLSLSLLLALLSGLIFGFYLLKTVS